MSESQVFFAIAGMALVTIGCRVFPFVVLGRCHPSPNWVAWMRYVPVAILSAVVFPQLFGHSAEVVWGPVSLPLLATIPTIFVGLFTRNLLTCVVVGVSALALMRAI